MNFGAETRLGGAVMSAFVFPLTAIAQVPRFDDRWRYSSQEHPWRFWLHCHDCHHVMTLMSQNSPCMMVKL